MSKAKIPALFPLFIAAYLLSAVRALSGPVAEPEYIDSHFCKTFGRGYIRIPGSEKCLQFSGFVRAQFDHNIDARTLKKENKAYFAVKVKSDTDLGRLRSKISFEATGDAARETLNLKLADATIELGKWMIGFTASNWVRYEWGGFNIKSGPFGYHKAEMVKFEDTFHGIKLRLATEIPEDVIQDYPSAIAHISKRGKWGSVFVSGVVADVEKGSVLAVKSGVTLKLNKIRKRARIKFQTTFGRDASDKYLEGERWDFIVAYSHPLSKKLTANFTFGASDDFYSEYSIAGSLVWKPFRKLKLLGEISYTQGKSWGGLIRVERRF